MKLVAQIKLAPTPEQAELLRETMQQANDACNRISAWGWEAKRFKQFDLHAGCYHDLRHDTALSSQVVVRCIAKVADAYKLDKATPRTFRPLGSIAYDSRILRYRLDRFEVSIWTVGGRESIPFVCGDYQREMLATQQGESDLVLIDGQFYLLAVCEVEDPPLRQVDGVLGVDLGIVQIATDSEGRQYSGEAVRSLRRRSRRLRAGLQHQAKKYKSKSAARHLARVRRRVSRFTRWVNHGISRRLVEAAAASGKALALENLSGIRERGNGFNREMRFELGNWSFNQLAQFVVYKARRAGIPVIFVDPRNTSRTCSVCGYCDKANRKSQSRFLCLECGREMNADLNAALNIAARGAVTRPMDGTIHSVSPLSKPPALAGG